MPAPQELSQQIPAPGQKLGCKSLRVGTNVGCKSLEVRGGGVWLWMKLIPALMDIFSIGSFTKHSISFQVEETFADTFEEHPQVIF